MKDIGIRIKNAYSFWKGIWAREIAAGLSFYFLLGFVPAACVLIFILGEKLPGEISEKIGAIEMFGELTDQLSKTTAAAVKSGGIILLATSVYGGINLFYRFRRCGEILYKHEDRRGTIAKKILSFVFLAVTVGVIVVCLAAYMLAKNLLFGIAWAIAARIILALIAFSGAIILNLLVCPYRISPKEIIKGAAVTFLLWVIVTAGFSVYMSHFANYERLYGAFASLFAFSLYIYFIMQSFTFGTACNILWMGRIKRSKRPFNKSEKRGSLK